MPNTKLLEIPEKEGYLYTLKKKKKYFCNFSRIPSFKKK